MSKSGITRRTFLAGAAVAAAGCAAGPRIAIKEPAYLAPTEKLNIATIGAGGRGRSLTHQCSTENIVALCDVDDDRAARTYDEFPNARRFKDYRKMLDEMSAEIDAVIIATPDHTHAVAALAAMQLGKHVYVEKPLTHNIKEARALKEAARRYGVVTQMGNQGHSNEGTRQLCEMIWSDWIGPIHTVHQWTNRPGDLWRQGVDTPPEEPVPDHLDWDLWLGPRAYRPFSSAYVPHDWRGFWDFGTGSLGDMGCHIMDPGYWALQLGAPTSVEVVKQEGATDVSGPTHSIVRYHFPERPNMPAVTVNWHDGGELPERPEWLDDDEQIGDGANGSMFIGEKGVLTCGEYGGNPRLLPARLMEDREMPEPMIMRSIGHYQEWVQACKGGPECMSNFDYAGPFTETVLLGTLALRTNERLVWDADNMRVSNLPAANEYIEGEYRRGWELA